MRVEFIARPAFPDWLPPAWISPIAWHKMPVKMGTTIAKTLVIHMIGLGSRADGERRLSEVLHELRVLTLGEFVQGRGVSHIVN